MTTEELEQIDTLIARRLAASAAPAERYIEGRRVRPHATVQDGMVYDLRPPRGRMLNRLMALGTIALLLYAAWLIFAPQPIGAPASTIAAPPVTTPAVRQPRTPPPDSAAGPPPWQAGIDNYNATQEARAAALEAPQEEAPAPTPEPPQPAWHAPMAPDYDVCAAWHVPLPWPAECGWHAPLVRP